MKRARERKSRDARKNEIETSEARIFVGKAGESNGHYRSTTASNLRAHRLQINIRKEGSISETNAVRGEPNLARDCLNTALSQLRKAKPPESGNLAELFLGSNDVPETERKPMHRCFK